MSDDISFDLTPYTGGKINKQTLKEKYTLVNNNNDLVYNINKGHNSLEFMDFDQVNSYAVKDIDNNLNNNKNNDTGDFPEHSKSNSASKQNAQLNQSNLV